MLRPRRPLPNWIEFGELTVHNTRNSRGGLNFVVGLCVAAFSTGLNIPASNAQETSAATVVTPKPQAAVSSKPQAAASAKRQAVASVSPQTAAGAKSQAAASANNEAVASVNPQTPASAKPHTAPRAKPRAVASTNPQAPATAAMAMQPATRGKPAAKGAVRYYVDFRARTAASYGHAFLWYGRTDRKEVEVAGLHPATDSVIPYIIGHILPVPSETGASYGDLDEDYLTASYRVYLSEAEAQRVFAYIKHLQASSPLWNGAAYNCVAFIRDVAQFMGLRTPISHWLYPETWVNDLRDLNGGPNVVVKLPPATAAGPAQSVY